MIYDKIKEACKEQGISVASLEKKAGLKNGSICKWSTATPLVTNIQAVAKVLGKPIEYFLDDST